MFHYFKEESISVKKILLDHGKSKLHTVIKVNVLQLYHHNILLFLNILDRC